jgi:hypothetical protein
LEFGACSLEFPLSLYQAGLVAEWLGGGLQNRIQRFESARDLIRKKRLYQKSNFRLTSEITEETQRTQRIVYQSLNTLRPLCLLCDLCGKTTFDTASSFIYRYLLFVKTFAQNNGYLWQNLQISPGSFSIISNEYKFLTPVFNFCIEPDSIRPGFA